MRKLKLIRIDETPRKFPEGPLKAIIDFPGRLFPFGDISDAGKRDNPFLTNIPFNNNSFLKRREEDNYNPLFSSGIHPGDSYSEDMFDDIGIPPHLITQIIKTNSLIFAFSKELEQRRVPKDKVDEFKYDSFKIGLRITEGILLQFNQPWLASWQFDLAQIHVENTIITLENFEEEKIGSLRKITILKQNCQSLIPIIQEFKEYIGLDEL